MRFETCKSKMHPRKEEGWHFVLQKPEVAFRLTGLMACVRSCKSGCFSFCNFLVILSRMWCNPPEDCIQSYKEQQNSQWGKYGTADNRRTTSNWAWIEKSMLPGGNCPVTWESRVDNLAWNPQEQYARWERSARTCSQPLCSAAENVLHCRFLRMYAMDVQKNADVFYASVSAFILRQRNRIAKDWRRIVGASIPVRRNALNYVP